MRQAFFELRTVSRQVSRAITGLLVVALATTIAVAPAAARSKKASPSKYAAIVMDARTGKILHQENADARRYPASLTKMMTLYLTFEAMQKGRVKKTTPVVFSSQASAQPPTKLGIKAGKSISLETAIYSLITRSANDSSVAIAELLGGSEQNFARMMTAKAQSLGMNSTVFRNPHGLPNSGQYTTARDMARLGIALREHFPQYYGYFSVKSFQYRGTRIGNHNRLLGRVKGVDGIKTGYTRASGFNLVSSVTDGNRRLVAVVMGGQSGKARDARMQQLIAANIGKTSTSGGALIARTDSSPVAAIANLFLPKKNAPTPDAKPELDVAVAETEEDTLAMEEEQVASVEPARPTDRVEEKVQVREQAYAAPKPANRPRVVIDPIATASTAPKGWAVQIASTPSKDDAKAALQSATSKAGRLLASAEPYTVTFNNDGVTYHRARFGGFGSQNAAVKTCSQLKKQRIACYAVQQ